MKLITTKPPETCRFIDYWRKYAVVSWDYTNSNCSYQSHLNSTFWIIQSVTCSAQHVLSVLSGRSHLFWSVYHVYHVILGAFCNTFSLKRCFPISWGMYVLCLMILLHRDYFKFAWTHFVFISIFHFVDPSKNVLHVSFRVLVFYRKCYQKWKV